MSKDLRLRLARGEYKIDADAVAQAMLTRAQALRIARYGSRDSQVLIAADRIEVRRVASFEAQAFPVQRTA